MARQKQQEQQMADETPPAETPPEVRADELPSDVKTEMDEANTAADADAVHDVSVAVHTGVIHALNGTTDELHAIQMRLAEIKPMMEGAIGKAKGHVKDWLQAVHDSL